MDNNNASVLNISGSLMTTDTYDTTSNPPGSVRSFSIFGDSVCGEPLLAQHLVVDFTPKEEIDTDFIQSKVCAFWQFVDVRPELKDLLVLPETDLFRMSDSSDILPDVDNQENTQFINNTTLTKERTAVSMLEFVEEKGLINRIFESKLPHTTCSLGSRQYHENELPVGLDKAVLEEKLKNDFQRNKNNADVRNMCKSMQRWDEHHPKCMQCPRHPRTNSQHRQKKTS